MVNLLGCYFLIPVFGAQGAAMSIAGAYFIFFLLRWVIAFSYLRFETPKASLFLAISLCSIVMLSYAYWWIIAVLAVSLLMKKFPCFYKSLQI